MSTRSLISTVTPDKRCRAIYCHYDGSPKCVGDTLLNYYTDQEKINDLISLGKLVSLRESLEESFTQSFHYIRGDDIEIIELESIDKLKNVDVWQIYTYLWDGDKWLVSRGGKVPTTSLRLLLKWCN